MFRDFGYQTGGAGIFLTDGGQYCKPDTSDNDWLSKVVDDVNKQGARFCTIAMSNAADPKLEELAVLTGGKAYFVPDHSGK